MQFLSVRLRPRLTMKLAQFKTKESDHQKLGIALGDLVCDVAELARAVQAAGGEPAEWLLGANNTLEVIRRGAPAIKEIDVLITREPGSARGQVSSYPLDAIEFLPAVYPQKILAIGRNYVDHAIEGGAEPPKAPLIFNKLSKDRKSTRLNSSHVAISYAVFCLKKKTKNNNRSII